MITNQEREFLSIQFDTVCKLYSNNSVSISLFDKEGNHILTKKGDSNLNFNYLSPDRISNIFNKDFISPNLKATLDTKGFITLDRKVALKNNKVKDKSDIININIKLVSVVDLEKRIHGYISISTDSLTYSDDHNVVLNKELDKISKSLAMDNIIVWTFNIGDDTITFLSKGRTYSVLRKTFEDNIHPDDLVTSYSLMSDMANRKITESNYVIRFKFLSSNVYRYYRSKSSILFDEYGKAQSVIGTYVDITDDYLKQRELKTTNKLMSTILAESSIMIWDIELTTRSVKIYNDSIFGLKREFVVPVYVDSDIASKEDIIRLEEAHLRLRNGESEKEKLVINIKSKDGKIRVAKCILIGMKNEIGSVSHVLGCMVDITAQVQKEIAEKKKSAMVDLVLRTDQTNVGYYSLVDDKMHVLLGENILGFDGKNEDEIMSFMTQKTQKLTHEVVSKIVSQELSSAIITSEFIEPETGKIRYLRNGMAPYFNEKGEIYCILISQRDITNEILKKNSITKYQINLGIVNKAAQIIYCEYDVDSKLMTTKGSSIKEEIPMSKEKYITFVHPDDRKYVLNLVEKLDNREEIVEPIEVRIFKGKYKAYRWTKFYIAPIINEDTIIGYTGIIHDTNDERTNRLHLERLNAQINQVMTMSEITPFICKIDKNQFYFTSRCGTSHSNSVSVVPDKTFTYNEVMEHVHPDDKNDTANLYYSILSGKSEKGWCKLRFDPNHKFEHTYILNVLPDQSSSDERTYLGYLQDITDHEILTKSLIDEKLKAEESEKLKDIFLANMSHEIRTPLNAIVGFSSLLADAESKEQMCEFSNIIQKNSDILLQLINDIIEISRISAGRSERRVETFNMSELFRENFITQQQLIKLPDVEIQLDIPSEDLIVNLDKRRTVEILHNFMSNAAKYTEKGHIRMGFFVVDEDHLRLYVEDTGCGIAEENKEKIFVRFEKLNSFVRGAGIGMSICQHYVNDAGGKIWVESELGKGSTFFVELKFK